MRAFPKSFLLVFIISTSVFFTAKTAHASVIFSIFKNVSIFKNFSFVRPFVCGVDTVTDTRDTNNPTYNTVLIGTQCWLARNENVGTRIAAVSAQTNNSTLEKYCYSDTDANCNTDGGLYQWAEAVQYLNGATNTTSWSPVPTGNVQGICPSGWHIPTDAQWTTLTNYLSANGSYWCGGNSTQIAKSLASTSGWTSDGTTCAVGNTQASNNSSGIALPAAGNYDSSFSGRGEFNVLWSSSEDSTTQSWYRELDYDSATVLSDRYGKPVGFSVRCVKN